MVVTTKNTRAGAGTRKTTQAKSVAKMTSIQAKAPRKAAPARTAAVPAVDQDDSIAAVEPNIVAAVVEPKAIPAAKAAEPGATVVQFAASPAVQAAEALTIEDEPADDASEPADEPPPTTPFDTAADQPAPSAVIPFEAAAEEWVPSEAESVDVAEEPAALTADPAEPAEPDSDASASAILYGYQNAATLGTAGVEAIVESGTILADGMRAVGDELMAFSQESVERIIEASMAIVGATSLEQVVDLQSRHALRSVEALMSESAKLTELSMEVANRAAAPLRPPLSVAVTTAHGRTTT